MKITCPSCAATYEVPEAVLAAKRPVRCARCGNNWIPGGETTADDAPAPPQPAAALPAAPEPVAPEPGAREPAAPPVAPPPVAAPEPEAVLPAATGASAPSPPPPPPKPPRPQPAVAVAEAKPSATAPVKTAPVAGWAGSIALLIILAAAAIAFRAQIMHAWPPSERVYAAFGLFQVK